MASKRQEEEIRLLAKFIDASIAEIYPEDMGFILMVNPIDRNHSVCDYVGNALREDAIKWMRETADRLEAEEDIPSSKHAVQ